MSFGEILLGLYGSIALVVGLGIYTQLLKENITQSGYTVWEKCALALIWLTVAGSIGMCWVMVFLIASVAKSSDLEIRYGR